MSWQWRRSVAQSIAVCAFPPRRHKTHTHVQTNDARIFPNGTAYITDVGMTGPFDSVIGVKKDLIVQKFLSQMPVKYEPEDEGEKIFSAVLVELDSESKKALTISHVKKIIK